jgi:hypothetical protein
LAILLLGIAFSILSRSFIDIMATKFADIAKGPLGKYENKIRTAYLPVVPWSKGSLSFVGKFCRQVLQQAGVSRGTLRHHAKFPYKHHHQHHHHHNNKMIFFFK